ncbi:protein SFI1 homolog [Megalops cyprinoides]|uniref:protein SFI1 homolog n=1 Tax=Megalops cyprinoides TaxID=118141 RepID=UPI00186433E7|nr:protein SFI1 homolog [Megalops cyprinoides]
MRKEQKKNLNKAACYVDGRCLRLAWESWLMYLEMQRVKQRMQMCSQEQQKKAALRWAWTQWRDCMRLRNEERLMEERALQHWAQALQNRAWLQLRAMYLQTCSQREEEARIKLYYSHGLQRKVLLAWTGYLQHRRLRREQKVIHEHAWHLMVVRRWWCRWRFVYLHRQNEKDRLLVADSMAQRNIKVQTLHRWMGYVNQRLQRAGRDQFAQEHYKHHLLNMGLRLLVLNVTQKKARRVDNNVALQQYQHSVIVRYWSYWKQRLEEIEERDQQLQKETAVAHYSTTLMRRSLHWWREHLTEHKIAREMELRANRWFAERTLQQCLSTWVEFAAEQQRNRERKRKASVHLRQQTYSLVFYTWLARSAEQREQRLAERMVPGNGPSPHLCATVVAQEAVVPLLLSLLLG